MTTQHSSQFSLEGFQTDDAKLIPAHPSSLAVISPPSRREGGETAKLDGLPNDGQEVFAELTVDDLTDNLLDQLSVLRRRINTGVAYCLEHAGTPNGDKGHARLVAILSREYLPRIDALRQCIPESEFIAERNTIAERLERGWEMDDSKKVTNQFIKLMLQYEVYEDVIQGSVINRTLDRVERASS
jgi:hypothetical protein